eukprot:TCALIF_09416-PA protein Name:"Similar to P4HA2 Prolyl 4-hydroxylase subunit alpha-2 (Gallus gallus)" AED:0.25 eAED:0.25 QI:0/0.66/0.5/1/1/1/10/0/816
MRVVYVVILVMSSVVIPPNLCEVFSSASDMQMVFAVERDIVDILSQYSKDLETKLNRIQSYLEEVNILESERLPQESDDRFLERMAGNPIHAYKLMKRFSVDWKKIEDDLKNSNWSAQSLIRLQDVYELDIRDMIRGKFGKGNQRVASKATLTAQDCLFMGKHCFNSGALARSLEWFEEAWVLAGREGNQTVSQDQIQTFIDHAAKTHDERVLNGDKDPNLFPKPVYEEPPFQQREKIYQTIHDKLMKNLTSPHLVHDNEDDIPRFNALCRGEELRAPEYVATLKCFYSHQNDPYYYLHPAQIEVAHHNPLIRIFHNVLSDDEMTTIRGIAAPLLMRSQVQGTGKGATKISNSRTSKTSWLQDSFDPLIRIVTQRVAWMTGLNTDTMKEESELLQVANYVNGGHYNPHHDYVMKEKDPNHMIQLPHKGMYIGDRIATWMFYVGPLRSISIMSLPGVEPCFLGLEQASLPRVDRLCFGTISIRVEKLIEPLYTGPVQFYTEPNGHASKSTMVVLLTLSALARAEVFSSGGNMKEIFRFDLDLLTGLEGYIENLEKRINNIDAYLDDFKKASSHLKPDDEPSDLDLGNPITSFNTVKRLSVFYKKVEDDLSDEPTSNFNRTLRMARRRSVVSPAESDLHGLAKALLRIQDVYQVEVPDLAKGKFASTGVLIETNATLTAQDCWYIGKHCYQEQKLSHSLEWFQQAVNLAEEEGNRTLPVKVAKDYLNMVAKEHDEQFWNPWGLKDKIFPKEFTKEPDVFEQRRKLNRDRENSTWAKSEYKIAHNGTLTPQTVLDTDIFNALCRGVEFRVGYGSFDNPF